MKKIELQLDEQASSNYFVREAFNSLRANVLFSGKHVKVIVITSCYAHEGKTSVSFDLCRNLAESGKKILLVDADLRKSVVVSRYTKERGVYGLSQILSGQVDANEAIYQTNVEGMDVVFAGPYPPNPTELVGSPAFKEFLNEEREKYDYVIIDAPPLGLVIDAAVMSSLCDGAILVINIGHVKYRVAQGVKSQIEKSGCKVLGVVLNQVDRKRSLKKDNTYYSAYVSGKGGEYSAELKTGARPASAAPNGASAQRPVTRPVVNSAQPTRPVAQGATPVRRPVQPAQGQQRPVRPQQTSANPTTKKPE
ncbi:MAG: polysaccharide biosynthesis tyrosine autokinase [Clostridia bacterium]|nr:polysaccharide biosynthesis tyrosine autokinase [Clostridia bacterium]